MGGKIVFNKFCCLEILKRAATTLNLDSNGIYNFLFYIFFASGVV